MKIVFFDIDNTLIGRFSTRNALWYMFRQREINFLFLFKAFWWVILERFNKLEYEKVFREGALAMKNLRVERVKKTLRECFEKVLKKHIFREGVELVKRKRKNSKIALVTAQYRPLAELFREFYRADYLICTELEIKNGRYTGKLEGSTCYGRHKGRMINEFIKKNKIKTDMKRNEAYSDSITDLSMLEMVGKPVAANPDRKLMSHAKKKGWEIITFRK